MLNRRHGGGIAEAYMPLTLATKDRTRNGGDMGFIQQQGCRLAAVMAKLDD